MFNIRPIDNSETDYEKATTVWNTVWLHHQQTAVQVHYYMAQPSSKQPTLLFLAEAADGTPIGQAAARQTTHGDAPLKLFVSVSVHPDWQQRGIGRTLYERLLAETDAQAPVALITNTLEDRHRTRRLLEDDGFVQKMRAPISEIAVDEFDSAEFIPTLQAVADRNITITPFSQLIHELGEDEAWSRMYEMRIDIARDLPWYEPQEPQPYDEWRQARSTKPTLLPDAMFVALHRGNWVGISELYSRLAMPTLLDQGLTGVRRAYRRMGLATALKLRTLDYAKRYGATTIRTDNEENNPMYQLNLRLGFRPKPGFLFYEKRLRGEAATQGFTEDGTELHREEE